MGSYHNLKCCIIRHRFAISLFILMMSTFSSHFRLLNVEGRKIAQTTIPSKELEEEKHILRALIGSRPPRCERRCRGCTHCEAIQVPTNPQIKNGGMKKKSSITVVLLARIGDTSNYKPMSWKCKCGNLIFNP